ncbi:MAG: hypothetical protein U9N54_04145, partial [candidate division Zixibacteria bacterium]|nr:hypothetical protein [candidate division Zixibacteria bacterium]
MKKLEFKSKSSIGEYIGKKFIALNAFAALIAILLIFVFIFKEALPIFYDEFIQEEVSIKKMILKQSFA